MQFILRDVLEEKYGAEETDAIFFEAGRLAGAEFYQQYIHPVTSIGEFISKTQDILNKKRIGILKTEEALPERAG